MNSYVIKHNEKHVENDVRCLLKFLTTINRGRYIKLNPKTNLEYTFNFSKFFILSRFKQDRYYFSQIHEMKLSFISSTGNMTYERYLKQPKSMCEIKLNELIARNPKLINCLNRNISHPLIRKYSYSYSRY